MGRLMVLEGMSGRTERFTKASGAWGRSKALVSGEEFVVKVMKEIGTKGKRKGKELIFGPMEIDTLGVGSIV